MRPPCSPCSSVNGAATRSHQGSGTPQSPRREFEPKSSSQYALIRFVRKHEVRELTSQFSAQIVPFDEDLALAAGALAPSTKSASLSLGDRACFALALRLGAKVLTADRVWARVAEAVGVEVELIR